ncbi:ubiquitin-conjugating enzyme E2, putative [Perkinsus marinus ATCC 50983]|uniref:Ubiquitin-conjugating enzyme E2, putative n=2 Tax=Perkinsus marinus (strain ATCC 50983 / TXsc) TaxID=423536 RepID=C5LIN1_PERM5|nr:ubiquitin-conjugating enzyme E2, putative [Perkinsus marinus ATCC 50983]EER03434.1 ubiquitin-conjugating enzyme E2, putative [Perkinsus marinus ATCC 50983]|eukprot:XP_002771618.1 ubiquitin-conjugating enzyme E2, putative [Perkinsus marinus ATCC 50983]
MSENRQAVARLTRELQALKKACPAQIDAMPSTKNMLEWHFVVFDLPEDTPYYGGVYHGKLVFPQMYPLKPPAIYMITPNGRFETHTKLCLSMSDFHPESWNPSWRVETILIGLVSFMLDKTEPRTTGGMSASTAYREKCAINSFAKNKFNKDFRELFPEFLDTSRFYPTHGYFHRIAPPEGAKNCADCGFPDNDAVFACKDFSKFCKRLGGSENHVYDPNSNDTDDLFAGLGLGDHHPYLIPTILAAVAAFTAIGYAIISSLEDSNENTI